MKYFEKISILIVLVQLSLSVFGQSVFDDGEIYTTWTKSTIISKSGDTLIVPAKYNPKIYPGRIEIKEGENTYTLEPDQVHSLSYFDSNIDSIRLFKNVEISSNDVPNGIKVFSEIFFENDYFAITRSIEYSGHFSLANPLSQPDLHLAIFIINKMNKKPLRDLNKRTFYQAMLDKEEEVRKYVKDNGLQLFSLPDQIELFKYYAKLKG